MADRQPAESDALLAFVRARLTEADPRDDTTSLLRQTIGLYERSTEMIEFFGTAPHHEVAAESYLNVLRLFAALWDHLPDYQPEFRCGWMEHL
ncbi:hypothetical protein ACQEVF_58015 [Nonomuraea polychroma]|uniref:hypothetical protein n=1 Tax=Nonomuraea polychroma TaxID=46176 RepID=UPI003D945C03